MNQGGRRPTIPGGSGGGAPREKKFELFVWAFKKGLEYDCGSLNSSGHPPNSSEIHAVEA